LFVEQEDGYTSQATARTEFERRVAKSIAQYSAGVNAGKWSQGNAFPKVENMKRCKF